MEKKIEVNYMGRKVKVSKRTYRALKSVDLCRPTSEDLNWTGMGSVRTYDPVEESQII